MLPHLRLRWDLRGLRHTTSTYIERTLPENLLEVAATEVRHVDELLDFDDDDANTTPEVRGVDLKAQRRVGVFRETCGHGVVIEPCLQVRISKPGLQKFRRS